VALFPDFFFARSDAFLYMQSTIMTLVVVVVVAVVVEFTRKKERKKDTTQALKFTPRIN
jgi:heme/copper-type cytochrome/quinol oxidase subunit 2